MSDDFRTPYSLSYYIMACDEDGLLYGVKIRGPSSTLEEAVLTTESECPELMEAAELAEHRREDLVLSEFVGVDFFEPLLRCDYDLEYKCKKNLVEERRSAQGYNLRSGKRALHDRQTQLAVDLRMRVPAMRSSAR